MGQESYLKIVRDWSKRHNSLISQESYLKFQINRQLDCFYFHNFDSIFESACQKSLFKIFWIFLVKNIIDMSGRHIYGPFQE